MGKLILHIVCLTTLLGCSQPSKQIEKGTEKVRSEGIVYESPKGTVTDIYDSTPDVINDSSVYHKYVCDKEGVYAGPASQTKYVTYKKTFLGKRLVRFEKVGGPCKVIK